VIAEAPAILALLEDAPHLQLCVGVKARRNGGCRLLADAAVCARLPFYARSSSEDLPRNACAVQKAGLRDEVMIDLLVASSETSLVVGLSVVVTGRPEVARFHERCHIRVATRKGTRPTHRLKVAGPSCRTEMCGARGCSPRGRTV
jgi:hypothetical protein